MKKTKLNKKGKSDTAKLIQELVKVSHDFIRQRDSISKDYFGGYCFDCGKYAEYQHFQAGHWESDSTGGALLRYHPHNIHGQSSGCNMKVSQERVKINYTMKMIEKYGIEYVNHLRFLKSKSIKADSIFYKKMIELYKKGNEENIVIYLESLVV